MWCCSDSFVRVQSRISRICRSGGGSRLQRRASVAGRSIAGDHSDDVLERRLPEGNPDEAWRDHSRPILHFCLTAPLDVVRERLHEPRGSCWGIHAGHGYIGVRPNAARRIRVRPSETHVPTDSRPSSAVAADLAARVSQALRDVDRDERSPGVGKTAISRELARAIGAVHLRIDSIEQALRAGGPARRRGGLRRGLRRGGG